MPLLHDTSSVEIEIIIQKLKRHKTAGVDKIVAELIQARGNMCTLRSQIHKGIKIIWNKEEFSRNWKESFTVPIYKKE